MKLCLGEICLKTYRSKVGNGYVGGFIFSFLFILALFIYTIYAGDWIPILFTASLVACYVLFVMPMLAYNRILVEEDGVRIRVGWYVNRLIPYQSIYAFQKVDEEANDSYALANGRVALYMMKNEEEPDVVTISPKDQEGFLQAFAQASGLEETPPTPEYQEIFDLYNENTSDAQRFEARKRVLTSLSKGYSGEKLKAENPEEFVERQKLLMEQWQAKQELKKKGEVAAMEKKKKWANRLYGKRIRRKQKLEEANRRKPGEEWLDE